MSNITHPLINPDSAHYDKMGENFILLAEKMFTLDELKAFAKINVWKYRSRIGSKDDINKEMVKIKSYEAYWKYLNNKTDDYGNTLIDISDYNNLHNKQ